MENSHTPESSWNLVEKISFRFFFLLFALIIVIQNNGAYPFWEIVMGFPTEWLHQFIPWVGKNILHLSYDITVFTNGSGDTTYDYVIMFVIFSLAFAGTIIWSFADKQRTNYSKLYYWLSVAVRFYLGLMLINYGLYKIVKLQFPYPGLYRLTQPYGDSSPMGLAWTFLGFSKGYNLFMGVAEILAVLLLFRRTMVAGAIITLMTASNVMAMNYFYDVPVKIISTTLVAMTLFLLARDAKRLLLFFFSGQAVSLPVIQAPEIKKGWMKVVKYSFKFLLIGFVLVYGFIQCLEYSKQYGDNSTKFKFYGLYDVDTFVLGTDTVPPLITDKVRWRQLILERSAFGRVRFMGDSTAGFQMNADTTKQTIELIATRTTDGAKGSFHYKETAPGVYLLQGSIRSDSVTMILKRRKVNKDDFRLTKREFNWINEYPNNQ